MNDDEFKIDIPAAEFRSRLLARACHHEDRAKFFAEKAAKAYDGKADAVRATFSLETVDEEAIDVSSAYSNKLRQPESDAQRAQSHRDIARKQRFIATHLPPKEIFSLDMQQVASFELIEAVLEQ